MIPPDHRPLRARQISESAITTTTFAFATTADAAVQSPSAELTTTSDPSTSNFLSPSSDFRTSTFQTTSFIQSSPSSAFSATSQIVTLSSAVPTSSSPSSFVTLSSPVSTTTPSPSSISPSSSPPTPSSGFVLSTFTSSFVTNINGSPTTIVTPIITALRTSSPSSSLSTRSSVIAGSTVAGLVIFIIALATVFIVRRRRRRQRYWSLSRKQLPSRATFLAGEEMDLPFPSPPFALTEHDHPFQSLNSHRGSIAGASTEGGGGGAGAFYPHSLYSPSQSSQVHVPALLPSSSSPSPPRLLRARASESGSIFQESVWPPPSAASQLIDPLTSPSHNIDLGRIVNDVMGPSQRTSMRDTPVAELGPLFPSPTIAPAPAPAPARSPEPVQEQEEWEPEGEQVVTTPPLTLAFTNMNPDDWPLSESQSPSPPATPPPLPQPTRWLNRSPNPSPRSSPLHRSFPI